MLLYGPDQVLYEDRESHPSEAILDGYCLKVHPISGEVTLVRCSRLGKEMACFSGSDGCCQWILRQPSSVVSVSFWDHGVDKVSRRTDLGYSDLLHTEEGFFFRITRPWKVQAGSIER